MTALLIVSVLGNLVALIFVIGARQAAKDAAVDTMRLDAIITELFTVVPSGSDPEWGVIHKGTLVASGHDLRTALDQADNQVADHG